MKDQTLEDRYRRVAAEVGHLEDKMTPADDAMVEFTYALDQEGIVNAAARMTTGERKGDWTLLIPYNGNVVGTKDTVRELLKDLQGVYRGHIRIYEEADVTEGAVYRFQNAPTEASRRADAAKLSEAAKELEAEQAVPAEIAAGIVIGATFGGPIGGVIGGLVGAATGLFRNDSKPKDVTG